MPDEIADAVEDLEKAIENATDENTSSEAVAVQAERAEAAADGAVIAANITAAQATANAEQTIREAMARIDTVEGMVAEWNRTRSELTETMTSLQAMVSSQLATLAERLNSSQSIPSTEQEPIPEAAKTDPEDGAEEGPAEMPDQKVRRIVLL